MFGRRRGILLFLLVIGIILMIQGVATASYFAVFDDSEVLLRLAGCGLALFVGCLGVYFGGYGWRRLTDAKAPIVIGPDGLHDRALSAQPIPWSEIRQLHVHDGGKYGRSVVFDLDDEAAARVGIVPTARMAVGLNRPFGYGYRIHHGGTEATADTLTAAIAPYAEGRW